MTFALDRELFSTAEAAALLDVAPGTLHRWLEDGRWETRERRVVTWGEFVRAALFRQYRQDERVPVATLSALAERLGQPHPLASVETYTGSRELVWELQEEVELDPDFCLVARVRGAFVLTPAAQAFCERVAWSDGLAAAWRPDADSNSTVIIDPERRFGRPSVRGISTGAIREHVEGGEGEADVAVDFGLTRADVAWALRFESRRQAA